MLLIVMFFDYFIIICYEFDVFEYGMIMFWSVYCKINFFKDNCVVL